MQYIRPTSADISLDNISFNVQAVRSILPATVEVMAVVKADAYGHGATEVAASALSAGATRLGVAIVDEAVELRRAGIGAPILVLGHTPPEAAEQVVKLGVVATVFERESALALSSAGTRLGRRVKVHMKIDTGMSRLGVRPSDAVPFAEFLGQLPHVELEGAFTHLATADALDLSAARQQLSLFDDACNKLGAKGYRLLRHAANTAAILALPESYFDMVRLGLGLYGMYPSEHLRKALRLRPAMSLKSRIAFLKWVEDQTPVGYGGTHIVSGRRHIATVPIGYADGYSRRFSNVAQAIVQGKRVPLVGKVCMDQCMFDVTDVSVEAGDEIVLMGTQNGVDITAEELAELMGTINYEITCLVNKRVPRVFWRNGQAVRARTLLGRS